MQLAKFGEQHIHLSERITVSTVMSLIDEQPAWLYGILFAPNN
jgi:hypothetical protein